MKTKDKSIFEKMIRNGWQCCSQNRFSFVWCCKKEFGKRDLEYAHEIIRGQVSSEKKKKKNP